MNLLDIPVNKIASYQQLALLRLQLWLTGRTHDLLAGFADNIRERLLSFAGADGVIDPVVGLGISSLIAQDWAVYFEQWRNIFEETRYQAAAIPFGQMARMHYHYFSMEGLIERRSPGGWPGQFFMERGELPANFEQQLQVVLDAAAQRIYGDGFSLYGEGIGIPGPSSRIWRLQSDSLAGMQNILAYGFGEMRSAWDIAGDLEQHLGFGRDCPRWTEDRLFGLTKQQIAAGDMTGLIRGPDCGSEGVAYNALRLARNEIQIVHHAATDEIFRRSPWVEGENVILSPEHPKPDICDDVVADNPYEVGGVTLPLHVQCLQPGQLIATESVSKYIEDICVGDMILTHLGRYKKVIDVFCRSYQGEILKITTKSGRTILITPDHPILSKGTWKAAGDLVINDALCVPIIHKGNDGL